MTPKINASPTKEFFISILVRDVKLNAAIADLVDNCVDGALRARPDGNYNGLKVMLKFDSESFSIEDNCGGIPAETAINYAFRFGRPSDMPKTLGSVGQFGVGMKRSLFKIGSFFNIVSISANSDFILEIDVDDWRSKVGPDGKELWEFEFTQLNLYTSHDAKEWGTSITVTKLHDEIALEFGYENFRLRLIDDLKNKHEESLTKGLEIEVNGFTLAHDEARLISGLSIKPIKIVRNIDLPGKPVISVEIYAGIVKDSDPEQSGWYVSCNGRLILRADKTRVTGWDEQFENVKIPKAHGQFARFRGYLRFTCDDADLLPWNTTKSEINEESNVYQAIKPEMILAMRQVIDFLNKLDSELDSDDRLLTDAVRSSAEVKLSCLSERATFEFPTPPTTPPKPKVRTISYQMPAERVERAMELLNAGTLKEVGTETFDYFMRMEDD